LTKTIGIFPRVTIDLPDKHPAEFGESTPQAWFRGGTNMPPLACEAAVRMVSLARGYCARGSLIRPWNRIAPVAPSTM
jgi:hypothetical protein